MSGFGSGSGSRAIRIKNDGDYQGGSGGSGGSGGRSGGGGAPSIKREDGGYVSSEEEDDAEFPRRDIDLIEISSDENEAKDTAPSQRSSKTSLPVRIGRKEHQERTFALNTDASSEPAAKILEAADTTGQALPKAGSGQTTRKGKGKSKDVMITGERKPFRGVWQDVDDSDVPVKLETVSDDENMADAEQIGNSEAAPQPVEKQEPASPDAERKPKMRPKAVTEPVLQTEEDRAEWARFQSNLSHIRAELGPDETPEVDESGDVQMGDSAAKAKKPTVRDNNVYLFQIPPLMPELLPPTIKKEPLEAQSTAPAMAPPQPAKPETKIKLEEGGFSDPSTASTDGPRFASGMVGKLRVRQSGRTTLDWGGTSYELTPGNKASFLQEVVSLNVVPDADRVVPEDAGDAVSLGRVKGKFVVVPDWADMLG